MNRQNAAQFIPLIQALSEGKTIQFRSHHDDEWGDDTEPYFDSYPIYCFRIKPEPRTFHLLIPRNGNHNTDAIICPDDTTPSSEFWEAVTVQEILL